LKWRDGRERNSKIKTKDAGNQNSESSALF
jgi:hypothetical protein